MRQVTDIDGIIRNNTNYEPYGRTSWQIGSRTYRGFTGEQTDTNGLVYLRARYYDPRTGSFLSKDPISGFVGGPTSRFNGYAYAIGNPLRYTDPSGMCELVCLGFIAIAIGAAIFGGVEAYQQYQNNGAIDIGAVGNAMLHGAVFGGGLYIGGLTCVAMPQACLAYTGWNVGYYGLREGIDWATPRTSGLGRTALILGRTLLDVGGIVTGSAFIREDFHAIGEA